MTCRTLPKIILSVFCALVFLASPAKAEEKILSYDVRIAVEKDSTIEVTETIKVIAEGKKIRRGIYRTLPVLYKTTDGQRFRTKLKVLEVLRDGRPEDFHIRSAGESKAIYVGNAERYISKGEHVYDITYSMDRSLRYFDDFDELYWNVTGNYWDFPIEKVTAEVYLPEGARVRSLDAYTGSYGSRGKNFTAEVSGQGGVVNFKTITPFKPREGLTVAVSWPAGYVDPPGFQKRLSYVWRDYAAFYIGFILILGLFWHYYANWDRIGRDPPKGTVIPLFHPPENISPGLTSYIDRQGWGLGYRAFSAALMNMAAKGVLQIEKNDSKDFVLTLLKRDKEGLSTGEKEIVKKLFRFKEVFLIDRSASNAEKLQSAMTGFRAKIEKEAKGLYFKKNRMVVGVGGVIALLGVALMVFTAPYSEDDKMVICFSSVALIFISGIILTLYKKFSQIKESSFSLRWVHFLVLVYIGFQFLTAGGVMLSSAAFEVTAGVQLLIAIIYAMGLLNIVFWDLMAAPTMLGREIMDHMEGFKLFLSVAEKERFEHVHPPELTPEIFEKNLPYAFALGVDHKWSKKFEQHLAESGLKAEDYTPVWYHSNYGSGGFSLSNFSDSLGGSLSGAVSGSISSLSSSGSSGGGGFSGGGGGGGGGGGW